MKCFIYNTNLQVRKNMQAKEHKLFSEKNIRRPDNDAKQITPKGTTAIKFPTEQNRPKISKPLNNSIDQGKLGFIPKQSTSEGTFCLTQTPLPSKT